MSSDSDDDSESSTKSIPTTQSVHQPLRTDDIAESKSLFQQRLMKFNIKPPADAPVPSFLRTPAISKLTLPSIKRESLDLNYFNPPASSTQNIEIETPPKRRKKKQTIEKQDEDVVLAPDVELEMPHKKRKKKQSKDKYEEEVDNTDLETPHKKHKKKQIFEHSEDEIQPMYQVKKQRKQKHKTIQNVFEEPSKQQETDNNQTSILNKFASNHNLTESDDIPSFSKNIKSSRFETFLIQIPKSVDAKQLVGCELSLDKKIRIKYDGMKYDCIPEPCKESATFFSENQLNVVQPSTTLVIRQHIKQKSLPDISSSTYSNGIAFPSNLKERHPLFGFDFLQSISLEESVLDKLQAARKLPKKHKHKKREKHQLSETQNEEAQDEEIYKLLDQSTGNKKHKTKKKKKKDLDRSRDESNYDELINQLLVSKSEDLSMKAEKKRKHRM